MLKTLDEEEGHVLERCVASATLRDTAVIDQSIRHTFQFTSGIRKHRLLLYC